MSRGDGYIYEEWHIADVAQFQPHQLLEGIDWVDRIASTETEEATQITQDNGDVKTTCQKQIPPLNNTLLTDN